MSLNVLGDGMAGVPGGGALEAAVQRHREQLESLAQAASTVERLDRELAELNRQRAEAVAEYERARNELVSGQAAGDAIAALGLKSVAAGPARRSARRTPKSGRAKRESVKVPSAPAEEGAFVNSGVGDGE